ncbi:hypothetical protein [Streptomyces sp. NBC_00996]|uniref:hypothetical protein n=1 Tax=Streptomyces sp. NBC_00996 TaxID=2903710 RepID=UPI0038649669|nr:hypothetical protein OG390_15380 [Streptomyces sp. NBC_00996]
MSSRFEFVDTGIGYGHVQRVAASGQFTRVQRAYRAYTDHGRGCATCAVDSSTCATAEVLWETYQTANKA